jgi:hypothetical protein
VCFEAFEQTLRLRLVSGPVDKKFFFLVGNRLSRTVGTRVSIHVLVYNEDLEVLYVKVTLFILLLFASLPDCGQNQTAVSDEQCSLSDF